MALNFILIFWRTLRSVRPPNQLAVATHWLFYNNISLQSIDVVCY